jgi:hypothetical protein
MARSHSHTSTVRSGKALDTREYRNAAKALRKSAKITSKALRKHLRAAGVIMAVEAQHIAGEHSESIPPTVKVRVAGATVSVQAGGIKAPIAGLFELGNQGQKDSKGHFRHPVFGDSDVWVTQRGYPFLRPAAELTLPVAQRQIAKALEEAAEVTTTGFEGRAE